MEKVEAIVLESKGSVEPAKSLDDAVISWVCKNGKCQQPQDKEE
jgi:hypothetical protein